MWSLSALKYVEHCIGLEEKRDQDCAGTSSGLEEEIKEKAAACYGSVDARVLEGQQEKDIAQHIEMFNGAQVVEGCQMKVIALVCPCHGTATEQMCWQNPRCSRFKP